MGIITHYKNQILSNKGKMMIQKFQELNEAHMASSKIAKLQKNLQKAKSQTATAAKTSKSESRELQQKINKIDILLEELISQISSGKFD